MSEFKVTYTEIKDILPHNNADSLELAVVYGFIIVVKKGLYKKGDKAIFVPIDSILPKYLEDFLFPEGSKIKLSNSRIKQIRIRKCASQGMLINKDELINCLIRNGKQVWEPELEKDIKEYLGIVKFEPPEPEFHNPKIGVKTGKKRFDNPHLKNYNGIDNFKWYPDLFEEGEEVYITEKLHGTSFKAGWVPKTKLTFTDKVKKFFRLNYEEYEFCYASNNVQLQNKLDHKGFYGEDIYGQIAKKYDLANLLPRGLVVYGEIIGEGIQKNYTYGCKNGEKKLVLFDIMCVQLDGSYWYLDSKQFKESCDKLGLERVPELWIGPFNKELVKALTYGDSVYCPSQKVREGVVIKPVIEKICEIGRKKLKVISEVYLDKDQSDFH